jgi:hypothetical protein
MGTWAIDKERLKRAFASNPEAGDFLINHWSPYIQEIDDIIDGDRIGPEAILETFARAVVLYSHPFYLKHCMELRPVALLVTNAFADTVAFERSHDEWKRQWADHYRHAGAEMVIAVAQICAGYAASRAFSKEIRCICHYEHHDREGKTT